MKARIGNSSTQISVQTPLVSPASYYTQNTCRNSIDKTNNIKVIFPYCYCYHVWTNENKSSQCKWKINSTLIVTYGINWWKCVVFVWFLLNLQLCALRCSSIESQIAPLLFFFVVMFKCSKRKWNWTDGNALLF